MRDDAPAPARSRRLLEGAATGLAFATALAALSVFAVGSFRPGELPSPYWLRLGWLRTDTFGFGCFVVAAVAFACSEFLRLSRGAQRQSGAPTPDAGNLALLIIAMARALALASTGLVVYLSVNSLTHPLTLNLSATHLLSFPTESTLRAIALVATACAVAVARTLRISIGTQGEPRSVDSE